MIKRSEGFQYPGVEVKAYKDRPGAFRSVTRRELFPEANTQFQTRYFEVAADGFTSFEMHGHEHCVVVVRGVGRVRLGDQWQAVKVGDAVHVPGNTPHQFENTGQEPFGILCMVDRDRDRPILLDSEGTPQPSET